MITKTCAVSGQEFVLTDEDLAFYQKVGVPVPTLCPEERSRRRYAFRNERKLYWRTCDGTGKKILSIYSPDKPYSIYAPEYWYSDRWNGKDYGRDFDFSRPFFEQFHELWKAVPRMGLATAGNENSEFVNYSGWSKNCYLTFDSDHNEDTYFQTHSFWNKDCVDGLYVSHSELCYECINGVNLYSCAFSQDCKNCSDSWFLKNCVGCKFCFGCVNLMQKEYYFFNQPCTKEEYFQKLAALNLDSYQGLEKVRSEFEDHKKSFPCKYYQGIQNENISGDYCNNSKNVHQSFDVSDCHDGKFLIDISNAKDCYDITAFGGTGMECCYEGHVLGEGAHNVLFSSFAFENVYDITYSEACMKSSHHLFGCTGLHHSSYCIFNKQYTQQEYEFLREKIVSHMKEAGEWGEFFPIQMSPFAYNETEAQQFFPLSKKEVIARGWSWKDDDNATQYSGPEAEIPDQIGDVDESLCDQILTCEATGTNYRIQRSELKFYQKMKLPIPRLCPNERHVRRMGARNPRKLWKRTCTECGVAFETTFSPERTEIILCEACYLKALDS